MSSYQKPPSPSVTPGGREGLFPRSVDPLHAEGTAAALLAQAGNGLRPPKRVLKSRMGQGDILPYPIKQN